MSDLPIDFSQQSDIPQNSSFTKKLGVIFVLFVMIGMFIGYLLNKYYYVEKEVPQVNIEEVEEQPLEGTITYIDPNLHPDDNISFVLVDKSGKDIMLLKAKDQKLEVVEGHYATVYGVVRQTVLKEPYLMVDRVVIKNVAN